MKLIKRLLLVLVALLLLAIIAGVALVILVDPNDYKPQIVEAVEEKTGRTVAIEGDLSFTFYPWLGVETGRLELGGHPRQKDSEHFARIESASAGVKLLSLFGDQIEIAGIELSGADVNLIKFRDGGSNWDDLASASTEPTDEPATDSPSRSFTLSGIELTDSNIRYRDLASGSDIALSDVNISVSSVVPGEPISVDGGLVVTTGDQAPIPVRTGLTILQANELVELKRMQISADVPKLGPVQVTGTALLDQSKDRADLQLSELALGPMAMQGAVSISQLSGRGAVSGSLTISEFSPRELMERLDMPVPQTSDDDVLRHASGSVSLGGTTSRLQIDPLVFQLDDTKLTGNLNLGDTIGFKLDVDTINIDRYLPPPSDTPSSGGGEDSVLLSPGMFDGLNVDGEASINQLVVSGLTMNEVTVKVNVANGTLVLNPKATLYDGRLSGRIAVNPSRDDALKAKLKLAAIQAQPLLKDLASSEVLSGVGRFEIDLTSNAQTQKTLLSTLTGEGSFAFRDGSINGINIAQTIRKAQAMFGDSEQPPPSGEQLKTDFSALGATFKITNGVLRNDDLDMKSPLLRVSGSGQANLAEQSIDYTVTPIVVETLEGQGGSGLADLQGVGIPIRFKGPMTNPDYEVDIAGALAASQHAAIEEKKDELKEKASSKLFELLSGKDDDDDAPASDGDNEGGPL